MVYLVKLIHFTGLDAAATDSNDILAEISVLTNKVEREKMIFFSQQSNFPFQCSEWEAEKASKAVVIAGISGF